jgi:hypothetical protein
MKEEVEQALRRGGAPPGYVVVNLGAEQGVEVDYPNVEEVRFGSALPLEPAESMLNFALDECGEILQREGYHTEIVPGDRFHRLFVYRRA